MQIKLNLQIFLFIIIFIFTHQIKIYSCIMIFAFIHELGHIVIGLLLKLKPKYLQLMPVGISITFEDYGYKNLIETKKILIAIAGPITNILLSLFFIIIKANDLFIYSNLLIAIFNLIPIYPLDGGRILKSVFRLKYSKEKSDKLSNNVSNIIVILLTAISSIIVLYLKNISILLVIVYLWIITIRENKKYNIKKIMYNTLKNNKNIDI